MVCKYSTRIQNLVNSLSIAQLQKLATQIQHLLTVCTFINFVYLLTYLLIINQVTSMLQTV